LTVTAPPRLPSPNDPITHGEFDALVEALIEEARKRAQRRRRRNGAIVILVALVGVTLFTLVDRTTRSQTASPALAARSSVPTATVSAKIAFVHNPRGNSCCEDEVYVMNADGSGLKLLSRIVTTGLPGGLAWSPDGRRIAFAGFPPKTGGIHVLNADGTRQRRLTRTANFDFAPTWSPDGRKIAFSSGPGGLSVMNLSVMNADGSGRRTLTNERFSWPHDWSPDGRKIAFPSERDGNPEVYVMNADGSEQRNLTRNPAGDNLRTPDIQQTTAEHSAWSPDGRQLLFVSNRDGNSEVYVMNADSSGQRNLTRNPAQDSDPVWSPDGRTIAFVRGRNGNNRPAREVYVMNADGSGQRNLTRNPATDEAPAWSPDGSTIAFLSQRDHNYEVYIMNADGTKQRNLTRSPTNDGSFAWSPPPR